MKRRTFIKLSGSITALTPFLAGCGSTTEWTGSLSLPHMLATFCSKEELISIGAHYMEAFPDESDASALEAAILNDYNPANQELLTQFLNRNIATEFARNEVTVIDGWILARTEARQVALFALLNS